MKNSFIRKLSLMPALVMILTMVMSVTAFAESLDNVPILDNDSGQQIGSCTITYTANQTVRFDSVNDSDDDDDIEITVVGPEEGTRLRYAAPREGSNEFQIAWDVKMEYQDGSARTLDGSALEEHMDGEAQWISGYDHSCSYTLTAYLDNPIVGVPDSFSTGINYYSCPTVDVNAGTYTSTPIEAYHGNAFNSQRVQSTVIPQEEEAVTYTGSDPGASEPVSPEPVSPSNSALNNLKWSLKHWATILQGMNDDQFSVFKFMDVGADVDLRGITVLDSEAVELLKQNNIVPLNITIMFQGKPFVLQIPAGFNFKKFEKSDGSIVVAELIWELISRQYGLM